MDFPLGQNRPLPLAETRLGRIHQLRNIPYLVIILVAILWVGIGEEAKIFVVAVRVLFLHRPVQGVQLAVCLSPPYKERPAAPRLIHPP